MKRETQPWPMTVEQRPSDLASSDIRRRSHPAVRYQTERDGRTFRSFWLAHDADTEQQRSVFLMNVAQACRLSYPGERLGMLQMEEVS